MRLKSSFCAEHLFMTCFLMIGCDSFRAESDVGDSADVKKIQSGAGTRLADSCSEVENSDNIDEVSLGSGFNSQGDFVEIATAGTNAESLNEVDQLSDELWDKRGILIFTWQQGMGAGLLAPATRAEESLEYIRKEQQCGRFLRIGLFDQ